MWWLGASQEATGEGSNSKRHTAASRYFWVSGCFFWVSTALFHKSFQRARGHSSLGQVRLGTDMFLISLPISPVSPAIQDIRLLENKGRKQAPLYLWHNFTWLLLSCLEDSRIGSCSQRRWGRRWGWNKYLNNSKSACPCWSAPDFPPALFPLSSCAPQLPKTTGQGTSRHPRTAGPHVLVQRQDRQPPQHLCSSQLPSNLALVARASCCCWAWLGFVTTACCECASNAYFCFVQMKLFMMPNMVFILIKWKY